MPPESLCGSTPWHAVEGDLLVASGSHLEEQNAKAQKWINSLHFVLASALGGGWPPILASCSRCMLYDEHHQQRGITPSAARSYLDALQNVLGSQPASLLMFCSCALVSGRHELYICEPLCTSACETNLNCQLNPQSALRVPTARARASAAARKVVHV